MAGGAYQAVASCPALLAHAFGTSKTVWPAQFNQVINAGTFGGEEPLKLKLGGRVIFHVCKSSKIKLVTSTKKITGKVEQVT
jgi:hypothetical protein